MLGNLVGVAITWRRAELDDLSAAIHPLADNARICR